jgi:hypothetical protein
LCASFGSNCFCILRNDDVDLGVGRPKWEVGSLKSEVGSGKSGD